MIPVIGFASKLPNHLGPETLERGLFRYAWLEGTMEVRFDFLDKIADWDDLYIWPAGRLFGEDGEYRWQQTGQGLHAVLILEDDSMPQPFSHVLPLKQDGEDTPLILWGDWINPNGEPEPKTNPLGGPRFWAREIPPILDYPLDNEQLKTITNAVKQQQSQPGKKVYIPTPRLVVRRYRHDPAKGQPSRGEFLRCVRLTTASEEDDNKRYKRGTKMSKINPYNFVPLPDGGPDRSQGYPGRYRYQQKNYSGELVCILEALSPLITLDQRRYDLCILLDQNGKRLKKPVKGGGQTDYDSIKVFRFMRNTLDTPIIQGSSLKGMIRAVFEAITRSCLNLLKNEGISTKSKSDKRTYAYEIPGGHNTATCLELSNLCPACRLFGAAQKEDLHCQGRLAISDAEFISGNLAEQRCVLKELSNPKPHHAPTYAISMEGRLFLRGRKFYYHQKNANHFHIPQHRSNDRSVALDEYAFQGCKFKFSINLSDVTPEELGLLLLAIELCQGLGHKFGLGKAIGLGSCRIEIDVPQSRLFKGGGRYCPDGPQKTSAEEWYSLKKGPDRLPPELVEVLRLNKPDEAKKASNEIGYPGFGGYPQTPINALGFFSNQAATPGAPDNWPPPDCLNHQAKKETVATKRSAPITEEIWEHAVITWTPGNQQITAVCQERKATARGKELVPDSLKKTLCEKRRSVTATVIVEPVGNAFRIVKILRE